MVSGALLISVTAPLFAQQGDKRTWRLKSEAGQSWLTYGTDNAEDTPITFSCKAGRGTVEAFINETSAGVKAGRSMLASLTADSVTAKLPGRTMTNEEAGTPSFKGAMTASDPLFAALRQAKQLVMTVGPSRQQVPLKEIGDKGDKFVGLCAKR
ncbi:MAG: hypothetical protein ACREEK_27590 [Bradyrhizobium sp.]